MVIQQVSGRVVYQRYAQLIADLGLDETLLGLGQLVLGFQNKEYLLGAQLVFALVGTKSVAGKTGGDFCRFHRKLGLLERVHSFR